MRKLPASAAWQKHTGRIIFLYDALSYPLNIPAFIKRFTHDPPSHLLVRFAGPSVTLLIHNLSYDMIMHTLLELDIRILRVERDSPR